MPTSSLSPKATVTTSPRLRASSPHKPMALMIMSLCQRELITIVCLFVVRFDVCCVRTCSCCLQSRPPGPDACMCTYQQSASALCILNGACLGSGTCQKSSFQCTGVTNSQPVTVCTNPGAVTCTISGGNEVDSTWFALSSPLIITFFLTLNPFTQWHRRGDSILFKSSHRPMCCVLPGWQSEHGRRWRSVVFLQTLLHRYIF